MGLPTAEHPIKHTYTPEDQQKLDATLQAIANSGKTVFDATKQNSKMFVIFADGTENNRWDKTLEETIISRLQRSAEKGLRELGAGEARYYAGPGTGVDNASGAMGKYLGADVDDIAERIYEDYASFVIKNPGVEVSIAGMGFSRGGGVLSFASHYIVERGVPDPTANKIITPGPNGEPIVSYDKYLVWPGEADVTKLVMGDRVVTGITAKGQKVKVKIGAYSFQKYGLMDGEVAMISPDATDPKQQMQGQPALTYRAIVRLSDTALVDPRSGERYPLNAGMLVTAEIHQGRRTVMEYLLSPVQRVTQEAARER